MKNRLLRKRIMTALALLCAFTLLLSACGSGERQDAAPASDDRIDVVVTIGQIAEPLSVIGGDRVKVQSLMGPGVDPHLYQATHSDIRKLEGADIIFYSGLHLEANLLKAFEEIGRSKPAVAIAEAIPEEKRLTDGNGAVDPHVWFDIDLWKQALTAATEQLKQFSESDAAYFEANKNAYFEKLDALKEEAAGKLSQIPEEKRVLVTAHDAFGYFGRFMDMEVVGLQGLSTESEVSLSDIEKTIGLLVRYKVPAVFVESSINPASIQAVIEGAKEQGLNVRLGGELFSDAMGAEGTEEGTYIGMYRHNVDTIYQALSGKGK